MASIFSDSFDVTTLIGSHLGLSALLPVSFKMQREYTLNNYLNIAPDETFNEMPKLRYFGVGINGCYNADDTYLVSAYNPKRINMNLFHLIPIRCRPVDEDLSDSERAYYRLRQRRVLDDGNEYYLYYLKCLEFGSEIKYKRINSTGAEEPYELDPEYLAPKPEKPSTNSTVDTTNTSSIVAYCEAKVQVAADEILEYITLKFKGDTRYARVSELGFFTGVDKQVAGTTGQSVAINYTEAIYTMLYNHSTWTGTPLTHSGMDLNSTFEVSSSGVISLS